MDEEEKTHVLFLPNKTVDDEGLATAGWSTCDAHGCERTPEFLFVWDHTHQALCRKHVPSEDMGRIKLAQVLVELTGEGKVSDA